jgi:hypothetical protein
VLSGFSVAKAQRTNTCETCRDSLQKAMYYGNLLSNKILLQDSLLSLRAETIKTLLDNNTRILLQKDSLLQVIDTKNKQINAIADKNNKYQKKVKRKNASIGFLIAIVILSVLL